jgi:hypothetical protein
MVRVVPVLSTECRFLVFAFFYWKPATRNSMNGSAPCTFVDLAEISWSHELKQFEPHGSTNTCVGERRPACPKHQA